MIEIDWEYRWQTGQTGWDLGQPSPPLCRYADQIPLERRCLHVLIPGCGNAYEAEYLLDQGFTNITVVDIAPTVVKSLQRRMDATRTGWRSSLRILCADFFSLEGTYDLVLEQTFFCALDPALRPHYARQMHRLLAPGGTLAGVLFDRDFENGPPFGGHAEEYRTLFEPLFHIHTLARCYNSVPPRAGTEVFIILKKITA
ncbi:MAG: TPMT family class I SAM-dependent methyltransferase [Saprospiraceae bacterium]|nr:TPMT family class I SAM-dependent methyltransferase [Saprospiraceae bacterium]MDW8483749.1 methyltransferase domain-containing protein [Saprospiraceae bacterium]